MTAGRGGGEVVRIDRVDVREDDDALTVVLGAGGLHVMLLRLRYDGCVDEVLNGAGLVAPGPSSWTLIGRELSLEFPAATVAPLGFSGNCRLWLDVDDEAIRRVRAALLEVLQCACFVVDTPEGRVVS